MEGLFFINSFIKKKTKRVNLKKLRWFLLDQKKMTCILANNLVTVFSQEGPNFCEIRRNKIFGGVSRSRTRKASSVFNYFYNKNNKKKQN